MRSFLGFLCFLAVCWRITPSYAESPSLVILAASSLTESLQNVATAWSAQGHPMPSFSFDASSRLAKQIEMGAPADLFFSADSDWMDAVQAKNQIDPATRKNLLGNSLVMVLPATSSLSLGQAADLAHPEFKRVGLAGENVPAGKYARAALQTLQVWPMVQDRVINGDNVRTVLGWVATGEVDAGAVYATDAKVNPGVRVAFTFPPSSYPPIVYPVAIVKSSQQRSDAEQFLNYCASEAGMAVFLAAGFTAAPSSASK